MGDRMSRSLPGVALSLLLASAWTTPARGDAIGPKVTVLQEVPPPLGGFYFLPSAPGPAYFLDACSGRPVRLVVAATDSDGLGAIFGGSRLVYAWNFGSGVPANSLLVFSNSPTVTFNQSTTVRLSVFDKPGNVTDFAFEVRVRSCS